MPRSIAPWFGSTIRGPLGNYAFLRGTVRHHGAWPVGDRVAGVVSVHHRHKWSLPKTRDAAPVAAGVNVAVEAGSGRGLTRHFFKHRRVPRCVDRRRVGVGAGNA